MHKTELINDGADNNGGLDSVSDRFRSQYAVVDAFQTKVIEKVRSNLEKTFELALGSLQFMSEALKSCTKLGTNFSGMLRL